jgi:TRAP-type C4-dicarboxylate transport system permease large subunit
MSTTNEESVDVRTAGVSRYRSAKVTIVFELMVASVSGSAQADGALVSTSWKKN